ncbi:MAG: hypothetical protein CL867_11440 [Cytophagaceae bacterium]|nr:hypothetical protein [Cytophagaceae bacterium]
MFKGLVNEGIANLPSLQIMGQYGLADNLDKIPGLQNMGQYGLADNINRLPMIGGLANNMDMLPSVQSMGNEGLMSTVNNNNNQSPNYALGLARTQPNYALDLATNQGNAFRGLLENSGVTPYVDPEVLEQERINEETQRQARADEMALALSQIPDLSGIASLDFGNAGYSLPSNMM